jgi:phage repressor protein C with HTH and peptisase S24 domain
VGIRQPTLSDLENDMSKGTTKLASIAKALNVRPYWLETGKGPMSAEALEDPLDPTVSADAMRVAKAFDLLQSDAQREAVLTQLRAFGVLE